MSKASLLADVQKFIGKNIVDTIDAIEAIAARNHYEVDIIDPDFNTGAIDAEQGRIHVRTDRNGLIVSFSTG